MANEPIKLGSAGKSVAVPDVGSVIRTNEFGVDYGTIRHQLGDQSLALAARPPRGSAYTGALPQFKGFFADDSTITGGEGTTCSLDITLKAINAGWGAPLPDRSHDLEVQDQTVGDFTVQGIPVPHPTVTYKFCSTQPTANLGLFGTPTNAPSVQPYLFPFQIFIPANGTTPASFVAVNAKYIPHPNGWLCLQDDADPQCAGRFFQITQRWKRQLIFAGIFLA